MPERRAHAVLRAGIDQRDAPGGVDQEGVDRDARRGRAESFLEVALGFGRLATFLNVTLPIGGRIALPSSINTYISVVKNTSLMYVISYPELTTTALNINALTLQTVETFTTLAVSYLVIVWTMSASIRVVERRLALPEDAR